VSTFLKIKNINPGFVSVLIIFIGIMLRVNVYVQNRSLFLDEANLARNIVEKNHVDLFKALDYEQYAPPLFSVVAKASTQVFGVNEFALRLPSLLAGIISLILLLKITNLLIAEDSSRWYVLLLFSFSILAIRYSTELKQYASDAAITLFFVFWALKCKNKKFNVSSTFNWSVLGAIAIWLSMPVIFVLASIGVAFLYQARKQKKVILFNLLPMGLAWLASFGIYFYMLLYEDASTEGLLSYHSEFFFNLFPRDMTGIKQDLNLVQGLFRSATDQTALSIIWAILTFLLGSIFLIRKKRFVAIVLIVPILLCLLASHLQLYSLIERLTLFMIPLIMVVMGIGISNLWGKSNNLFKVLLVSVMLISLVNKKGYQYFWSKLEKEDSKSVLLYLSKHRSENELIYVQADGVPGFVFYNEMHDKAWNFKNYYLARWDEVPADVVPKELRATSSDKFWLFFSHTFPQENIDKNLASAAGIAQEVESYISLEASTYAFIVK
jgi:hypothetical protein